MVTSAAGTDAPIGSIGPVLPGVELRLVDADGDDVLVGDSGEIWVRGPNVFAGYWNDPEATATALTPDGWLRTGDIGVVDDDGVRVPRRPGQGPHHRVGLQRVPGRGRGRADRRTPPSPRPRSSGVPHPHTGEAVKAYVVLEPGTSADEDDIIAFCTDRLARYKCPSKVMFVDELPHNVTGKLLRRALR